MEWKKADYLKRFRKVEDVLEQARPYLVRCKMERAVLNRRPKYWIMRFAEGCEVTVPT